MKTTSIIELLLTVAVIGLSMIFFGIFKVLTKMVKPIGLEIISYPLQKNADVFEYIVFAMMGHIVKVFEINGKDTFDLKRTMVRMRRR